MSRIKAINGTILSVLLKKQGDEKIYRDYPETTENHKQQHRCACDTIV